MRLQPLQQRGIQTNTDSDVVAIHHPYILLKQVGIMLSLDKKMRVDVDHRKRRSLAVCFEHTQLGFHNRSLKPILSGSSGRICKRENRGK